MFFRNNFCLNFLIAANICLNKSVNTVKNYKSRIVLCYYNRKA